tara:strand:+ start:4650 stop:5000 length:351 start_codon:yes stop_codon:yes gene_type:complete
MKPQKINTAKDMSLAVWRRIPSDIAGLEPCETSSKVLSMVGQLKTERNNYSFMLERIAKELSTLINPVRNDEEHRNALSKVSLWMDKEHLSKDEEVAMTMQTALIVAYEDLHYPIG